MVSCRISTTTAQVRFHVSLCGIYDWQKIVLGLVFFGYFGFPWQLSFQQLLYFHCWYCRFGGTWTMALRCAVALPLHRPLEASMFSSTEEALPLRTPLPPPDTAAHQSSVAAVVPSGPPLCESKRTIYWRKGIVYYIGKKNYQQLHETLQCLMIHLEVGRGSCIACSGMWCDSFTQTLRNSGFSWRSRSKGICFSLKDGLCRFLCPWLQKLGVSLFPDHLSGRLVPLLLDLTLVRLNVVLSLVRGHGDERPVQMIELWNPCSV